MSTTLKIYYDTDIAQIKYNGNFPFESGKSYTFDQTSYTNLFKYVPKNGTFTSGDVNCWWCTNKYFATGSFNSDSFSFSENTVIAAYNQLQNNGTLEPFLCLTSPRYYLNGVLNQKRPLIICGNYVSKQVINNGNTDTITVTFDSSSYLTDVKIYYRDSSNTGQYETRNDGISTDKHSFTTTVPHLAINDSYTTQNDYSYIVVPTVTNQAPVQSEPTIDLLVTYNNGLTTVTDYFSGQKAGTIKGTVTAGTGYTITGVSSAYYSDKYGNRTNLTNFSVTKISDYQYSYSFDLTAANITALNSGDKTVRLSVTTTKQAGNINIDSTKLEHCSILPATITQGQQTVLTLNADSGYILNGTGTYTVDGTTTSFTCTNVSSYQITVTANTSVSISFVATQTETKPSSIIHTYILSQDNYNNLGKQIIDSVNSSGTGFEQYDYTKFVNYLYQIPFQIGTDMTTSTSTINLGKQNLNIDCQKVTRETVEIDLGSIDLTDVSNSHDYKPINITLYSPFSNNIILPVTVLGSKLYLSFSINLKYEQGLLLVKQNGNLIYSGQTELFTDLPLYYSAGLQDSIVKQLRTQYQNTINQAYIVVNYNKPITDLTSYKTLEHGVLSNYKGFTRVTHGTLKHSVSSTIDQSLLNLLRQGVIIK